MGNPRWTGLVVLLLTLGAGQAAAQICQPESIPASTPDSQLQDNGDGTITDRKTGLMWKQCSEGQSGADCASGRAETFTWQQALQQAQAVNSSGGFAGFSDWRVPNIKELSSLVEHQCAEPAINLTRFPNTLRVGFWSASVVAGDSYYGSGVHFNGGKTERNANYSGYKLRLVRSVP